METLNDNPLMDAEGAVSEQVIRLTNLRQAQRKLNTKGFLLGESIIETEDRLGHARVALAKLKAEQDYDVEPYACPACGGGTFFDLGILGTTHWVVCRACGIETSRKV